MTDEGTFPKIPGDVVYASEYNLLKPIQQIYVGSAFDVYAFNSNEVTGSIVLNAIGSVAVKGATYAKIEANVKYFSHSSANAVNRITLRIDKRNGTDAYVPIIGSQTIFYNSYGEGGAEYISGTLPFNHYHTLTAADIASGLQFLIHTTAKADTNDDVWLKNMQTVVSLM